MNWKFDITCKYSTNEWSAMRHIEFLRQQWYRCPNNAVGVSTAGNVDFRQRSFGIKHVVFLRVIFHFFTKTWRRKLGSSPSAMSDVTAVCSRVMLGAVVESLLVKWEICILELGISHCWTKYFLSVSIRFVFGVLLGNWKSDSKIPNRKHPNHHNDPWTRIKCSMHRPTDLLNYTWSPFTLKKVYSRHLMKRYVWVR